MKHLHVVGEHREAHVDKDEGLAACRRETEEERRPGKKLADLTRALGSVLAWRETTRWNV